MRGLVQRVRSASVTVTHPDGEQELVGAIGEGLCVLLGVTHDDDDRAARAMAAKLWNLRVFDDADGVMNLSAAELGRPVLVVSQFTLYGDTRKGNRPSWIEAAGGEEAEPLYDLVCEKLDAKKGIFGADMKVELVNDGPVTLLVET